MTEVVHAFDQEDLGMGGATFSEPGLTSFCRLDGLGLVVVGQRVEPGEAVLACEPVERDAGAAGAAVRAGSGTR